MKVNEGKRKKIIYQISNLFLNMTHVVRFLRLLFKAFLVNGREVLRDDSKKLWNVDFG